MLPKVLRFNVPRLRYVLLSSSRAVLVAPLLDGGEFANARGFYCRLEASFVSPSFTLSLECTEHPRDGLLSVRVATVRVALNLRLRARCGLSLYRDPAFLIATLQGSEAPLDLSTKRDKGGGGGVSAESPSLQTLRSRREPKIALVTRCSLRPRPVNRDKLQEGVA